ncbi:MAG: GNAT family N-acetyltransferase [Micavibrio aeruginosavorus]|uniref:GNAT family N-acetyltransferase n=1 Tax=Micavibrio aeruginosavorus TaxID=349221 RepID=A0A7T5R375_9BACT|nr:MAG: GNAT family N-acetyltransferase [Micavibrio aeruginosavorus]
MTSNSGILIRRLPPDEHHRAKLFYRSVGYMDPVSADSLIVAAFADDHMIGAVRLCTEYSDLLLRGMMIAPGWQRQGIGSRMLQELERFIGNRPCHCLPHDWLTDFYGQIGFVTIPDDHAPGHLRERLHRYRNGPYPHVLVMRRPA